jgi:hypothetical protein
MVSMHQSGTHWLKYMLATAMAQHYGVPGPKYNHANDIIGGPKDTPLHPQLPRIISSHGIPHLSLRWSWVHQACRLPRYLVLVRDIRDSLISNYAKWRQRYGVSFSKFLRGDMSGHGYNSDIWWCIRYLNAWGRLAERFPDGALVVRYEDLQAEPLVRLQEIVRFLDLPLSDDELRKAIEQASKERMAAQHDPQRPDGEVRLESETPPMVLSEADQCYLSSVCRCYLRYDFGYIY